jgi:hypothetical protein
MGILMRPSNGNLQMALNSFVMPVCPSAFNNSTTAERIFMKFDAGKFHSYSA